MWRLPVLHHLQRCRLQVLQHLCVCCSNMQMLSMIDSVMLLLYLASLSFIWGTSFSVTVRLEMTMHVYIVHSQKWKSYEGKVISENACTAIHEIFCTRYFLLISSVNEILHAIYTLIITYLTGMIL